MRKRAKSKVEQPADWLTGGSEMGRLIREMDWGRTPLGPLESWSPSLKMMVRFLLANRFPLLLWWGPQFIQIYNDSYIPVLGTKHPTPGLGRSVSECWSEIWHILRPLIETPFNGGPATWMEDILLEINRYGFIEETHFTIAYSPVPDETVPSSIGGVLATVHEISEKVVGERRIVVLRDLGTQAIEAKTAEEACAVAATTLTKHQLDIPFALLYLIDSDRQRARVAGAAGISPGSPISPPVIELNEQSGKEQEWPLAETVRTEALQIVEDLSGRFGNAVPPGPWADPPRQAVVTPIRSNIAHQLAGLLVVGISSRLQLNDSYCSFIELAASQIATAVANARAYEEERKRAEALAELDRAKTAFFSNVSHEFRTPLALMLGPLEDTLAEEGLPPKAHELLSVAHRNSQRLLKLVNTLLDFSRIEAGRIEAAYEPVDLAAFTSDLASVFRSTIERAGLKFIVDCPPLPEDVYVDREMWEKIVLNLLSNAFKFTFKGEITVRLRQEGKSARLTVSDAGTGIPAEELPRLFERFHRIKGSRSRSYEGSGIGLALVQELAKLHGGSVHVTSEVDRGSEFTVTIPLGKDHLPANRIGAARSLAPTGLRAQTYIEEALRWLPFETERAGELEENSLSPALPLSHPPALSISPSSSRILLVDDNADMREYVQRLLSMFYEVVTAADGEAALEALREQAFDVVLTDVMMPRLDGFGLLKALREDERTRTIPVILLSARAGEESRVEGLGAGADDYLIKPFSARELLARVEAHLKLQRVRHEAELAVRLRTSQFETLLNEAPHGVFLVDDDLRIRQGNPTALSAISDIPDPIGRDFDEMIHILLSKEDADAIVRLFRHTLETGEPYFDPERVRDRLDRGVTEYYEWQINRIPLPEGGYGVVCYFRDISAQVLTRRAIAESEEKYRTLFDSIDEGFCIIEVLFDEHKNPIDYRFLETNPSFETQTGIKDARGRRMREIAPQHEEHWFEIYGRIAVTGEAARFENPASQLDRWYDVYAFRVGAPDARKVAILFNDITERKRREANLALLSEIDKDLAGLSDIEGTMNRLGAKIGEYFNASHCLFSEVTEDRETAIVSHGWHRPGFPSMKGVYRLRDFISDEYLEVNLAGEVSYVNNTTNDTRIYAQNYAALGIGSFLKVPWMSDGRWRFTLCLLDSKPRDWREEEVELMRELTARIWMRLERARAEQALRESEERLQLALDAANMGTFVWYVEADRTEPDARMLKLFDLPVDGQLSLATALATMIHPADSARFAEGVERSTDPAGPGTLREDVRVLDSGRKERWLAITGQTFFTRDTRRAVRIVGTAADITERKRAEEALREADRRKDEFLAMLAHELRNPLAPIRNAAQLLNQVGMADADQRWACEVIGRQTQHLTHLVDDLLDVSRITSGKVALQRETLELATIINRAVETSRPLIETRRQQLILALSSEQLCVKGDLTRLVQVISNLLNNAAKYTDEGGHIWLAAARESGEAVLSVRDDGMGLPADLLPSVFDLFTQGNRSIDRSQGGLGIGLTLVRNLVELHGGQVEARSEGKGRGSEFIVRLPLIKVQSLESESERTAPEAQDAERKDVFRVLVVEDNLDLANLMAMIVRRDGHEVQLAHDGLKALEVARAFQPQVVLCDIGLPEMNGYEFAKRLREQPEFQQIRLIALSGYGQEEARRQTIESGFDYHLIKPVEPEDLRALLNSLSPAERIE